MSELSERLKAEFKDKEYRYAYAKSASCTHLAAQLKVIREQRGGTQNELSRACGVGIARFEDVNCASWNIETLWKMAEALGVRVHISFETFGGLIDQVESFNRENLTRLPFDQDPGCENAKPMA